MVTKNSEVENISFDLSDREEDRSVLTHRFMNGLQRLIEGDEQPTVRELTFLSDLSAVERVELAARWQQIPLERRRRMMRYLVQLGEDNVEYDFDSLCLQAIEDDDTQVRKSAAEGLWESHSSSVMNRLLEHLSDDESPAVRAAAALSLGHFVYRAEMGEMRAAQAQRLRDTLLASYHDTTQPTDVRRRAMEAVSYLSDDAEVTAAINAAYGSDDAKMQVSAVHAMGRNMDVRWLATVLRETQSELGEMRYEAARAAGEISDKRATSRLIDLLVDTDSEVRLAAVWALGQVGGQAATNALKRIVQSEDEAMREAAADALAEARLNDDPLGVI